MKLQLFAAAAACALVAAAPAFAEDAAPNTVDELVVTGRAGLEAQRKVEASYAVTTISEEKLRMQAPVSVAEVLKNVPGFWVEASGGEAGANIRARGIPIEGYAAIGLNEDGFPSSTTAASASSTPTSRSASTRPSSAWKWSAAAPRRSSGPTPRAGSSTSSPARAPTTSKVW
uniref:Plug domain-containing protein n=1 Tax=Phenylobacterium glaciei TaxID=2803784 RepID=A0A974SA74_9CAUL|nr:Plug domain-containing protein [Phenylobacterium glaciei]